MKTYMVVETFRPDCFDKVYERFAAKGRMLPGGLHYVNSWVTADKTLCFQLMETDDPNLFVLWTALWEDLVEFEIHPIAD